eukprot:g5708.t1
MFPPILPSNYNEEEENVMTKEELHLRPRHCNMYESMYGSDDAESSDEVGTNLSKAERERRDLGTEFVYGEVTYRTMARLLSHVLRKSNRRGSFVDFGSGTGKAVFSAALLKPSKFTCSAGAEYMESLHDHACEIRDKHYKTRVKPLIEHMYPDLKCPRFISNDPIFVLIDGQRNSATPSPTRLCCLHILPCSTRAC